MSQNWNMSDERAFLENLLNQRFNFFIVLFSAIIASYLTIDSDIHKLIILGIGCIILFLMSLIVFRSQRKLDEILKILYEDPMHPTAKINNIVGSKGSKRKILGYTIPILCLIILIALFIVQILKLKYIGIGRINNQ